MLKQLQTVQLELVNARGAGGSPETLMNRYISWATAQASMLQEYLAKDDVERLILTRSFYALLDNSTGSHPRGFPLLDGEIRARLADLELAIGELTAAIGRWRSGPQLVVLDTNVYIHAKSDFTALDLRSHLGTDAWHLLILLVNLDELDGLKRSGKTVNDRGQSVRTRARLALRLIEEKITEPDIVKPLNNSGSLVEVVMDPRRHQRLASNDDELVERSATIRSIAGRPVHLLTGDTGMLMRGRSPGLEVHRLDSRSLDFDSPP